VNLSHNSNECRIRKFTAHSQHPTATFNDQQGGNGKKDGNWMKWNSPRGEICGGEIKLYKYYKNRFMKNLSIPSNIQKALTTTAKGPLN
jgi:hypothetical protein